MLVRVDPHHHEFRTCCNLRIVVTEILRFLQGNRSLLTAGCFHIGLFCICFALSLVDDRLVAGVNPWLKPMKFCLSIAAYSFTFSILLGLIDGYGKLLQWLGRSIALMMYVEIACITIQAARGVTSHYNVSTGLDGAIFGLMGLCIALNTVLDGVVLGLYILAAPPLPPAILYGIRFGLAIFVVAAFEGGAMIMNQAHTVGAVDGGPGLPWVNWSTQHGDLRVAHFLGLHALQILPICGILLDRLLKAPGVQTAAISVLSAGYAWVMWAQMKLAFAGQPFLKS